LTGVPIPSGIQASHYQEEAVTSSKSKAVLGTADPGEKAPWEEGFTPTPASEQQVAVVEPADVSDDTAQDPEYIEGKVLSMRKAADWVQRRHFGERMRDIIAYIASKSVDTQELNAVILERLAARMLDGEGPDAILDPFGTLKGKELLNRPLMIVACDFLEGDYEESFPWYVSLMVEDNATGGITPVTTGGEKVVIQAAVFDMKGLWPQLCQIKEAPKATRAGFRPLELTWAHH
jgi:hypothetical protein